MAGAPDSRARDHIERVFATSLALAVTLGLTAPPTWAAPALRLRDPDTRAWWALTGELSSDAMEGRDTGSRGHARAARLVAGRFSAAGLRPAGTDGFLQSVPVHEVRADIPGTSFGVTPDSGPPSSFRFLHEITVRPTDALPATVSGRLVFRGYCGRSDVGEVRGKVVVCFGSRRRGVPGAAERTAAAVAGGAVGLIAVDDPGFTLEPARWPEAYARSVTLREPSEVAGSAQPTPASDAGAGLAVMRLSAQAFARLIAGAGQDAAAILEAGATSRPLPSFNVPARFHAAFALSRRDYSSDNVLGLLPGRDPKLAPEVVVLSAHLDGYGYGEPVGGDALYNGAFDDAAYVATLIRLAEQRRGRSFRRSVLFAVFTGEEKGLLGATWFTRHPTVPKPSLAADINLDQIRPLFPLKILTMHALDDTTLGAVARGVAAGMGVALRSDREPERNLNQRADHWPFLKIGVPATGFVFGYDPGSEAERRYREWYQIRYHRPQDDMSQPIDFQAAADFNSFFYRLTEAVAEADARPAFFPASPLARH